LVTALDRSIPSVSTSTALAAARHANFAPTRIILAPLLYDRASGCIGVFRPEE